MKWDKKGLIYTPQGSSDWMNNSALQPTPLIIGDYIRVYVGFRDKLGVSRIGYVDVNANNPSIIKKVSEYPVLDVGEPGCFDDNGVVPCAVFKHDDKLYLFYAGYNLGHHVRMTIYGGLAVSTDNGNTFQRYSKVPVMERSENERLFRVVHTIMYDNGKWKIYYGAGSNFIQGKHKTLPVYNIMYMQVDDFTDLKSEGIPVIRISNDEYRVGRPYVIKRNGIYCMFFGAGTEKTIYRLAYAESTDGENWERMDDKLGLEFSKSAWDSEMTAYPAVVIYNDKTYMFYNGNNYGYDGFGYAVLVAL